ncbi:MAG: hypothetical protein BWY25_01501 [Chloroflexi bacterium ADurb.Bin222]|nr:MAG: hypothetical protein BWY25_01501 [Chloroflexi bacterium ADurb.Bin222]
MHAALVFELRVDALAADLEDHLFEAANASVTLADDLRLPTALALGEARVHAEEFRGEQPGLVATRPRADLHDHILLVAGILGQQQLL